MKHFIESEKTRLHEEKYQIIYIADLITLLISTIAFVLWYLIPHGILNNTLSTILYVFLFLLVGFCIIRFIAEKVYDFLQMDGWIKNTNGTGKVVVKSILLSVVIVILICGVIIILALLLFAAFAASSNKDPGTVQCNNCARSGQCSGSVKVNNKGNCAAYRPK